VFTCHTPSYGPACICLPCIHMVATHSSVKRSVASLVSKCAFAWSYICCIIAAIVDPFAMLHRSKILESLCVSVFRVCKPLAMVHNKIFRHSTVVVYFSECITFNKTVKPPRGSRNRLLVLMLMVVVWKPIGPRWAICTSRIHMVAVHS
jgi:hypothetical protein